MRKNFFSAEVRKVIVSGIVCMLLLAVVSCENVKYAYDEEYVEECVKECDEECKFDLSELNEKNCHPELGWAVEFRLKPEIIDCPIENPEIKALKAKHNVTFSLSFPGASSPVLMRYYTLEGEDCSNLSYVRAIVRAFLATGLFEHVRVFGIYSTAN